MLKRVLISGFAFFFVAVSAAAYVFLFAPRPIDTTEPRVFIGDAAEIDYCDLTELDGTGLKADDIPKAYTPACGYVSFPQPILASCTEPLAEDVVDMRGLWQAYTGSPGHVERIEQCGNRTVVTSAGVIHDFRTDGTLRNGARDVSGPGCLNIYVAISYEDGVMKFRPFGLPKTIVTRRMEGDDLVWTYPMIEGEVRMKRICRYPLE
jgi:hypothetical protein